MKLFLILMAMVACVSANPTKISSKNSQLSCWLSDVNDASLERSDQYVRVNFDDDDILDVLVSQGGIKSFDTIKSKGYACVLIMNDKDLKADLIIVYKLTEDREKSDLIDVVTIKFDENRKINLNFIDNENLKKMNEMWLQVREFNLSLKDKKPSPQKRKNPKSKKISKKIEN